VLRHILKQLLLETRDMDEYEKHRIKAPKLLLYLNLFLYTSLVLYYICDRL
jgi:hypothetical protein